jgi:hypothetical protein
MLDMFAALAGSTQALAASGRVLFVVGHRAYLPSEWMVCAYRSETPGNQERNRDTTHRVDTEYLNDPPANT